MKRLLRQLSPCLLLISAALHAQEPERVRDVIYTKHDGVALTMERLQAG